MFDGLFIQVLNMTRTASIVIVVVILIRLMLRKAPKLFLYALWAVVLFRLLCPFTFESVWGLVPGQAAVENYTLIDENISFRGAAAAAWEAVGDAANGGLGILTVPLENPPEGEPWYTFALHWEVWILFGKYVWVAGIAIFLLYSIVSYTKLKHRLVGAVKLRDNIWLSDGIESPFVVGVISPKIYLPSALSEREQGYIILHEQTHIRRGDHIVKILSFAALCVHWFNPLVWVAFILSGRDMEMSCDESVMRRFGEDIRQEYSASLLSLATGRRMFNAAPLAFGEGETGGRIRNVLKFRKPSWVVVAVVTVLVVALSAGLAINRASEATPQPSEQTPQPTAVTLESDPDEPSETMNMPLLSLDDSGENDDTVQLINHVTDGKIYAERVDVVVTLGNGEVLTKSYEGFWMPGLYHTDLMPDDNQQEIIVTLAYFGSTYGAFDTHVLKVIGGELTEILTILDIGAANLDAEQYLASLLDIPQICNGFEIVRAGEINALKITHMGKHEESESIVYWDLGNREWRADTTTLLRTETISLEGMSEEIRTKLFVNADGYSFYYDYERYVVSVEGNKTLIYSINDPDMNFAYAAIEYVPDVLLEDEMRLRIENTAKTYTDVTRFVSGNGFYVIHDDGKSGLWSMEDYQLNEQFIPYGDGCFVLSTWYIMEAAEGHGTRLRHILDSFAITTA